VSSHVSFEVFVRPALRAALGHPRAVRPARTAVLGEPWTSPAGRRQFRRGVLDPDGAIVREVGTAGSHMLGALARAECLVVVPEDVTDLRPGTDVEIWWLDG
jgi:molybdopterin molybdotransferase